MEVLSSRILLRPTNPARSHAFYGDVLGLAVYREFGTPEHRGVVYFLGNGLLEVSGRAERPPRDSISGSRCGTSPVKRSGWPALVSRSPDRLDGALGTGRDVDRRSRRRADRRGGGARGPPTSPGPALNSQEQHAIGPQRSGDGCCP